MIPPDTHAVFELLPPQGDALATCLELARSRYLLPCLLHPSCDPSPMFFAPPPIILFILPHFMLSSDRSFLLPRLFFGPRSSTSLVVPVCAPLCLPSFNTCQDSRGTSYTARISFERAPQDVIIRIITGPYGWCYISVPSHTEPSKLLLTSQLPHHANQNYSLRLKSCHINL